jgi:hypothetical protein
MIEYRAAQAKPGMSGLGQTGQIVALQAPQIAGATIQALAVAKVGWAAAAVPIIGPIVAGVTLGLMALFARKGPRQKVATTQIVDKVEPLLAQNRDAYLALPVRTASAQAQALANFDAGWQYVVDNCGIPEMGDPGRRCIEERQRGGKWDWFALYRDPIEKDPNVVPDEQLLNQTGGLGLEAIQGSGIGGGNELLIAGIAVIGLALLMGGGGGK